MLLTFNNQGLNNIVTKAIFAQAYAVAARVRPCEGVHGSYRAALLGWQTVIGLYITARKYAENSINVIELGPEISTGLPGAETSERESCCLYEQILVTSSCCTHTKHGGYLLQRMTVHRPGASINWKWLADFYFIAPGTDKFKRIRLFLHSRTKKTQERKSSKKQWLCDAALTKSR